MKTTKDDIIIQMIHDKQKDYLDDEEFDLDNMDNIKICPRCEMEETEDGDICDDCWKELEQIRIQTPCKQCNDVPCKCDPDIDR